MKRALTSLGFMIVLGTADAREFAGGQVWTYKTRPGEQDSTLQVNRVEDRAGHGRVHHISVTGLRIKAPRTPDGFMSVLQHLPVSQQILEASVVELSESPPQHIPFEEGYAEWMQAGVAFLRLRCRRSSLLSRKRFQPRRNESRNPQGSGLASLAPLISPWPG